MKINTNSIEMSVLVTEKDYAIFGEELVHPVYSTFSIARDAERAGRKLFLENKEDGEDSVGTHVKVDHKAPAFLGQQVIFEVKAVSFEKGHFVCSFVATVNGKIIAEGTTGQKIMNKEKIQKIFNPE